MSEKNEVSAKTEDKATTGESAKTDVTWKKAESVVPRVVRELIEESETIEGWVRKLAEHGDESYPEVLRRVREDYIGRMEGVAEHLTKHRSDLLENLEERKGAVETLRADRASHAADLEEVRLRHVVGEFSDEDWDSRRVTIQVSLDEVDSLLAVEEGAVTELTSVVDTIGERVRPMPRVSPVLKDIVRVDAAAESSAKAKAAASWSAVLSELPEEQGNGASEDELAFLETVSPDNFQNPDPVAAMLGRTPRTK